MTRYLIDRYGSTSYDVSEDAVLALLRTLDDSSEDAEHYTITVSGDDDWSLEISLDRVLFERVTDTDNLVVGCIYGLSIDEKLSASLQLLRGNHEELHTWNWMKK